MIYSVGMYGGMLPCEAQIPDTLFICSFITAEEPLTYYRVFVLFATPRLSFFPPAVGEKQDRFSARSAA